MLEALLIVFFSVAAPQTAPQDSVRALARRARSAAFYYESLLRRLAPERFGSGGGDHCDEIIGRFCFTYDDPGTPPRAPLPPPEAAVQARLAALRTHRRWFSAAPADPVAAGRVVRYLVDDDRESEAVATARTHAWAAHYAPESLMLLGLALHEAGDFAEAEEAFDSARAAMPAEAREKLDDVGVLLEGEERKAYERLDPEARERYLARFWAFSDPSLLEPGNERRSAHYARHAWAAILEEAPRALGMESWGADQEEILLRFGRPVRRERQHQYVPSFEPRLSMVEWFDPHMVSFVPARLLTEGIPFPYPPGRRPDLERDTAHTQYAPVRLHRMHGMSFQSTVFPGASLLRIDAFLPADTARPFVPEHPRGLIALLDTMGHEVGRVEAMVRVDSGGGARGTVLRGTVPARPGVYVARAEVDDESTGLGGLAQFRVDVPASRGLSLSDLVVGLPFAAGAAPAVRTDAALVPLASLEIPPGEAIGLYVEVYGLPRVGGKSHYAVSWQVEPVDDSGAIGRAVRWLGRTLGLARRDRPVRVAWEGSASENPAVVAFTLDLSSAGDGLKRVTVEVTDAVSGASVSTIRLLRIRSGAPAPGGRIRN